MALRRVRKVYVLMFDANGSGESGDPVVVCHNKLSYVDIMDYGDFDSPEEIKAFFHDGILWWKAVHMR